MAPIAPNHLRGASISANASASMSDTRPRDTMIAKGSSHARLVPAGATVFAPPIAAMFDPEEFPRPWTFEC